MATAGLPNTDAICMQIRNVLTNGPRTTLDEVLVDFIRGYMKHRTLDDSANPCDGSHSEDIKAALKKKGYSQKVIADRMKVSPTTVHNVICGACKSERIAKYISGIVEIDRSELWPGRYSPVEERLRNAA